MRKNGLYIFLALGALLIGALALGACAGDPDLGTYFNIHPTVLTDNYISDLHILRQSNCGVTIITGNFNERRYFRTTF